MRFVVAEELGLFAESVAGAVAGWEAPLEPELGSWWDDRDDALASRLAELGWRELWIEPELRGAAVAGATELGRVVAPLSLIDEATLGAPLAVGDRVRHGRGASQAALVVPGGIRLVPFRGGEEEPTLDGTGTLRALALSAGETPKRSADRLATWRAATLGYLAGLAAGALATALSHVRSREQFGAPLGALAVVQGRLAEAALLSDGLELLAWRAVAPDVSNPGDALAWATNACREVTAQALQVHGGIGFALEGGVHRYYRRAKVAQVWLDAVRVASI